MPIYEYECPKHGKFEIFLKVSDKTPDLYRCPKRIINYKKKTIRVCNCISEMVYSLVSMQPDKCWSGITLPEAVGGGYVTSKKEYDKVMKNYVLRTRSTSEAIAKKKQDIKKELAEKADKLRKKEVARTIAEFDLPSDYKIH